MDVTCFCSLFFLYRSSRVSLSGLVNERFMLHLSAVYTLHTRFIAILVVFSRFMHANKCVFQLESFLFAAVKEVGDEI